MAKSEAETQDVEARAVTRASDTPTDVLLIFVGHSNDADLAAAQVKQLEAQVQRRLDHIDTVTNGAQRFRRVKIYEWDMDAPAFVDGQKQIDRTIDQTHIGVFVFQDRVGAVTEEEMRRCQERKIPVIAVFAANPSFKIESGDDAVRYAKAFSKWQTLQAFKRGLPQTWTDENSNAIRPQEEFRTIQDLERIVLDQLELLLPHICRPDSPENDKASHDDRKPIRTKEQLQILYESLAPLERACPNATCDTLNWALVERFAIQSEHTAGPIDRSQSFLRQLGLFAEVSMGDEPELHKGAVLCFCNDPLRFFREARAVFVCGGPVERVLTHVRGPLSLQFQVLFDLAKKQLGTPAGTGTDGLRLGVPDIPEVVIREVISNAIAHRDYEKGHVKVEVNDNELIVSNPGEFPANTSWNTFISNEDTESIPRDEIVATYLMFLLAFEGIGQGFRVFRKHHKTYGEESIICDESTPGVVKVRVGRRPVRVDARAAEQDTTVPTIGVTAQHVSRAASTLPRKTLREVTLNSLLQRCPKGERPELSPDIELVPYSVTKQCVLDGREGDEKDAIAYVVHTEVELEVVAQPLKFSGRSRKKQLEAPVSARLKCPKGGAKRVVAAFGNSVDPLETLSKLIHNAARNYIANAVLDGNSAVLDLIDNVEVWEENIAESVAEATGLQVVITIDSRADLLKPVAFATAIQVYVHDAEDALTISCEFSLEALQSKRTAALLGGASSARMFEEIAEAIRLYIPNNYGIHEFCTEEGRIKNDLRNLVNATAAPYGRCLGVFKVHLQPVFAMPKLDIVTHRQQLRVKGRDEPIEVEHHILLQIENTAAWRRSGITDVPAWIESVLAEVAQLELFERNYVDVISSFDSDVKDSIRFRVETEAAAAGFRVKQFSSVINDELKRLQDSGFRLDFEEEFATRNSRVPVTLNIVINGKVETREKIEPYLSLGNEDVRDEIRATARNAVAGILHETSPERFYLHFEYGSSGEYEQSVERELADAIDQRLRIQFGVLCKVNIKQLDTQLTDRFSLLVKSRPEFRVTALPVDGIPLDFRVKFRIAGVHPDHWGTFVDGGRETEGVPDIAAEVADITDFIKDSVSQRLRNTLPMQFLEYRSNQERQILQDVIFKGTDESRGVVDEVAHHHGVMIEVTHFQRDDVDYIMARRQETLEKIELHLSLRRHILDKLKLLEEQEKALMKLGGTADGAELDEIRKEMRRLEAEAGATDGRIEMSKLLDKPTSPDDFAADDGRRYLENSDAPTEDSNDEGRADEQSEPEGRRPEE